MNIRVQINAKKNTTAETLNAGADYFPLNSFYHFHLCYSKYFTFKQLILHYGALDFSVNTE
jgi:hypothetical protein